MFNAKDLLDVLMRGAQGAPQQQGGAQQGGGLGGLGDILGQVLGGGGGQTPGQYAGAQPGQQPPQGGGLGGGLGDILGQLQKQLGGAGSGAAPAPQQGGGGGLGGGLGDIFGQLQKQLGGGAGSQGGQAGQPGGSIIDILGQVFGQATSGVKEGAGRINVARGASDRLREAIAQATGKSPDEVLAQVQEWIRNNPGAAAAGAGGLGAVVLGTQTGRSLAGSAARLGALALIGGLAYKAFQNYQQGRPLITGADSRQALVEAPQGTGFEPAAISNESATLYIRAMIAAAAADGRIDANEQKQIIGGLAQAGIGEEAQAFLQQEVESPATVDDLAAAVTTPEEAVQVYTAARLAIDPDTDAEGEFLSELASRLGIDEQLAQHIDATTRAAAA